MSALRLLFIYERGETHAAVRAFRTAFARLPDTQLSFGADTLVFAGRDPIEQIRAALRELDGVLVLLGPAGLAPSRTLEAIALREAALMELPLLFVCTAARRHRQTAGTEQRCARYTGVRCVRVHWRTRGPERPRRRRVFDDGRR